MKSKIKPLTFFDIFLGIAMCCFMLICLYPLVYVFSMSISNPIAVARQEVWFLPKGFSLKSYNMLFKYPEIWTAYGNTIWYTVVGTTINVFMTVLLAYPLSRKSFCLSNKIMLMVTFTMFFSGGMIPSFILINKLGLYDTRWAIIIPGAIGAYYVIIARTFFYNIPESLIESAKLDGANDLIILMKIMLPISMPLLSVLMLYYAVSHWNSYFSAMIYLQNKSLQPLQLYLRRILIENTGEVNSHMLSGETKSMATMQIKYSVIIIATLPILCVYPFLQKYFVKGVMIGSIKA